MLPYDPSVYACVGFPVASVAIGVVWLWWRARRARRVWRSIALRSQLRCERCGYDVRASPERCPECGEPVRVHPGVTPPGTDDGR